MSVAIDLYMRSGDDLAVAQVLSEAGFEVTTSERRLANGSQAPVFCASRDTAQVSITVMPLPKDPRHLYLSLLAKPRFSATLRSVADTLEAHGALTSDQYAATSTI